MVDPATIQPWFTLLGSIIAFTLFLIKLYELFWRDRLKLATTYELNGHPDHDDEVILVNLSPVPVFTSSWSLAWKPRVWNFRIKSIDVTPDKIDRFKIDGNGETTLYFSQLDKITWNHEVAHGRQLVLHLTIFGRRLSKKLIIGAGK